MSAFIPYPCSRGTVVGYDGNGYLIQSPTEGLIGWPANGTPSSEMVEYDIANPPAPVVPVPEEVPMWAIRAVLDLAGLTPTINAILAQLPEPDRTIVLRVWEYGNYIRRASPVIESLRLALDKTPGEVDAYFVQAGNLNP